MKLSRSLLFMISLVLIIALSLSGCGGTKNTGSPKEDNSSPTIAGSKEEVIEMNVNNPVASTHHVSYNVFEPWKKLVEEKTNGRVKVNLHYSATLGSTSTAWKDINSGLYDVTLIFPTYFSDSELFPLTIGNLPFAFPDSVSASKVLSKFGEKYANNAYKDAVLMGTTSTDAYDLLSKEPIRKVEDLKGNKIRVQGKEDSGLVKEWGGSPVSLKLTEIYESMQKGILDIVPYTPTGSVGLKLYEVSPYMTRMGLQVTPTIMTMNADFYNKLPEDLKTVFDGELNPRLAELLTESYGKELDKALAEYAKQVKGKGEIITLSQEELQKFKAAAKPQWENWVKVANEKGYPGEQMMKDFRAMLQEEGLPLPY